MCLSLSLFLSLSFLIDTKTARRVRQHSRRVVSFRLFRSRRGSVSLCALLIFLPLHRVRLCVYECVYVCVCAFASLCVCQLLILYKHTHACALAHTLTHIDDDGKRGTLRRWVEERQRERERRRVRERRSPYIYWRTRRLLCCLLDI